MQYQQQAEVFLKLIDNFLNYDQSQSAQGTIESISNQLTAFIKRPGFLQLELRLLQTHGFTKDKLVLITSLLKDKLKYEIESLQRRYLHVYYRQICKITQLIQCHNQGAFTNLSLALAYIYISMSAETDQPFQSFLASFVPSSLVNAQIYNYYFKVLEYIASEIDNSRLVMDEEARFQARRRAIEQQQAVLRGLNENASRAWEMVGVQHQNILQCFTCWVNLGYNAQVLNSLPSHCLLPCMFDSLREDSEINSATECLKIIINLIRNPQENAPIFEYLGQHVMDLMNVVNKLVEDLHMDEAEQYLTIVLDFSRKSARLLLQKYEQTQQFLGQLVVYTGHSHLSNYENFCSFWEVLLEEALTQQNQGILNSPFFTLLPHLYDSLCRRCKYSMTIIRELDSRTESKVMEDTRFSSDQTHTRRQQTATLFDKISRLQGKESFLAMVSIKIRSVGGTTEHMGWSQLQVYLLSLVVPLRKLQTVNEDALLLINSFIELTDGQTITPLAVKRAFLRLFRSLMSVVEKNVTFIQKLFYLTSTCFATPLLMDAAQRTFAKGCEDNATEMQSSLSEIIHLLEVYPECSHIARGIFTLILNSNQAIPVYLPFALNFLYQTVINPATGKQRKKDCMHALIAAAKTIKQHPQSQRHLALIKQFTSDIWEWFKYSLSRPQMLQDDEDPEIERLVKLMKNLMRCLGLQFREFVPQLSQTLSSAYEQYPVCSYLYLVQVAVTVFCGQPDFAEYFQSVYVRFCELTYAHLDSAEKVERYHFLLDDFIGVNKRFFIFNAGIVLSSGQLPYLLDLCISAFMSSRTPRVAKACYSFFESIFMVYWRKEFIDEYNAETEGDKFTLCLEDYQLHLDLRKFLFQKIEYVLLKMLEHLSQVPVELTRECILDALMAELKAFPEENLCIWESVLGSLDSDILVVNEKQRFKEFLQRSQRGNFEQCKQASQSIQRYLVLINRRMMNANKRRKLQK